MIENERQFQVTLDQRARLAEQLEQGTAIGVPGWVDRASRDAVESQIRDLDAELTEYAKRNG